MANPLKGEIPLKLGKETYKCRLTIDSLVRISKNSKKFRGVKHILKLDTETLGYETINSNESFLKSATRLIEDILRINPLLCIDFNIKTGSEEDNSIISNTLNKLYKKTSF